MPNSIFLQQYPLLKKFVPSKPFPQYINDLPAPPINMRCRTCGRERTYNLISNYTEGYPQHGPGSAVDAGDRSFRAVYRCEACKENIITFYLHISFDLKSIIKIGQFPPWETKLDTNLSNMLGKHAHTYKKGLVCESQSYGIGAFAYYRRIVEEIIDELLTSIVDLINPDEKDKYNKALEKVKKTRITQDKIELVKDLLPSILRPNGYNPLEVLHSKLSEGMHSEKDEECLEIAGNIRDIILFLVNQIIHSKETALSFSDSMKKILEKKSEKNK